MRKNVKMVTRATVNSGEAERKKMKENKNVSLDSRQAGGRVVLHSNVSRRENRNETNRSVKHGEEVSHKLRPASRALK